MDRRGLDMGGKDGEAQTRQYSREKKEKKIEMCEWRRIK